MVVGASRNPARFSHRAVASLLDNGYMPIPVHPAGGDLLGQEVVRSLKEIVEPVDTVSLYVRAAVSDDLADSLLALSPRRVVFNPGAENASLAAQLQEAGIQMEEACTLVLLDTGQF